MNWLLDTCVLSEGLRPIPSPKVAQWLDMLPNANIFISVLTLGELHKGAQKIADVHRARKIEFWIETEIVARLGNRILPVNNDIAVTWGALCAETEKRGVKRPATDSLLAATAQVHHLTLVTRNVSDFLYTGISVVNPWEEEYL